jgi:hypothetical protein
LRAATTVRPPRRVALVACADGRSTRSKRSGRPL